MHLSLRLSISPSVMFQQNLSKNTCSNFDLNWFNGSRKEDENVKS